MAKGFNIVSNKESVDNELGRLMRTVLESGSILCTNHRQPRNSLKNILHKEAHVQVIPKANEKIVVFVTKESHCLGDLLIRSFEKSSMLKS